MDINDTNASSTTGFPSATHISGEVDELRRRTRHLTARSRHLVVQTQNAISSLHPTTAQANIRRALQATRIPKQPSVRQKALQPSATAAEQE